MENTLENKEKLFAQYWGQQSILRIKGWGRTLTLDSYKFLPDEKTIEKSWLELKPLSSITDEDSAKLIDLQGHLLIRDDLELFFDITSIEFSVCFYPKRNDHYEVVNQASVDYLRSKGYALPFHNLSVENQVEYGWIKLPES